MWKSLIDKYLNTEVGITELEANGPDSFFIKQSGVRKEIKVPPMSSEDYMIETMALIQNYGLDGGPNFLAEGAITLEAGGKARVHIVLPPVTDNPQVTIAKKSNNLKTLDSLRRTGMFTESMQNFMEAAVDSKFTIILSGGTGVGKTTMLEALTRNFDDAERIGVVEDVPELVLPQKNVIYQTSTIWKPGTDINDVATLSWCIQQLNRQRIDRIIIGETRGGEFADFIVAANSGNEGSISTIHANNPRSAARKMSNFVVQGLPQPVRSANENIANTVDVIIQLGLVDGKHRVISITEVTEVLGHGEDAPLTLHEIYEYNEDTDSYRHSNVTDTLRRKFINSKYDPVSYRKELAEEDSNLDFSNPLQKFSKGVR